MPIAPAHVSSLMFQDADPTCMADVRARIDDVGAELRHTRMPKPRHDGDTSNAARTAVEFVGVLALTVAGFFVGRISAQFVVPDLDLDVYVFNPAQRNYYWAFLVALGFGFMGAAVVLALADHRRTSQSPRNRRTISGLKKLLCLLAFCSVPAVLAWAAIFCATSRLFVPAALTISSVSRVR